jgi:hypothetical protein
MTQMAQLAAHSIFRRRQPLVYFRLCTILQQLQQQQTPLPQHYTAD